MSSKAYYQRRIEQSERKIWENKKMIQILKDKLRFLEDKKIEDEQYLSSRIMSFLKLQNAKSKGAALYGEKLSGQVNIGLQMTFFSNFNKIDTNIKRKISSLKEENLILQRKIDYCSHEIQRIEQEDEEC
jgi:hypothetical protein